MSKKKTLFYIWGYGSSPESNAIKYLKQSLGNKYNVVSDYYAQYNPAEALIDLNELIKQTKPDIIVASSLGGYLAMQIPNIPKVIINPCVRPDIELPKLTTPVEKINKETNEPEHDKDGNVVFENVPAVPEYTVKYYTEYIEQHPVWETFKSKNEKQHTVFIMGDNDEVLGTRYHGEVTSYCDNVVISEQGHSNTLHSIEKYVVPAIEKLLHNIK